MGIAISTHLPPPVMMVAEKRNGLTTYGAGEPAAVVLLKLDRIREPPEHVAQRVDGETDQHLAPFGAVIMREHALVLLHGSRRKRTK
jgi:hypothetical protein